MGQSLRLVMLSALVLALAATNAGADAVSLNRQLSALYVETVQNSNLDVADALQLAETALEFDPVSSDALYLRAYLLRGSQKDTGRVVADLDRALRFDNFESVDPARALVLLGNVLLRTGQPARALEIVNAVDLTAPDADPDVAADVTAIRARAALETGSGGVASLAIARGRRQFPEDARFFLLELNREPYPDFSFRRELERFVRTDPEDEDVQRAVLRYALTAPVATEREWAVDAYLTSGGEDPAVSLSLVRTDPGRMVRTFVELDGVTRRDVLLDLVSALEAGAEESRAARDDGADNAMPLAREAEFAQARSVLAGAIANESVVSLVDRNGDGFWEERVTVAGGMIRRWELDRNQDGATEVDLRITGGEPASVTLLQSEGPVTVRYETYPFAATVSLPSTDGTVRYRVRPFTFRVEVIRVLPVGGPRIDSSLELSADFGAVDLSGVALASVERELLGRSGNVVEVHGLDDGVVVTARRDTNADGRMDHLVVYENGKPVNALRDIDGDGYFEIAESYVDGEISMVSVDEDDNGTPDVTEYSHNSGERTWDLNQDGVVDVREFGIWSRAVTVEFPFLENRR